MKKILSQILIALVCSFLGFMIVYQYKVLTNKVTITEGSSNNDSLLSEISSLKKEKEELINSNSALSDEVKKYEQGASGSGNVSSEVQKQFKNSKMLLGLTSVRGTGIIIEIQPKTSIFNSVQSDNITLIADKDLTYLVNVLTFAGAEAISINDYRITSQTGIKVSGNFIGIGKAGRISPNDKITIKAIGDRTNLKVGVEFQGLLESLVGASYTSTIEESDDILIEKTNQELKSDYVKESED